MPIFYNPYFNIPNRNLFTEIEATRPENNPDNATNNTDYTEDDQQEENRNDDNPADAPEDYTVPDEGEDQTPEEGDNNPPEEGTQATGGDPVDDEQYDTGSGDEGGGNEGGGGDAGEEGQEEGEDYTNDSGGDDDYGDESEPSDDEVKRLEDEIFSNYNADQLAIMNTDLKKNFNRLFVMLDDLVDHINDIPKVAEHIELIEFVSNKLAELRDMVSDYLYKTYKTKSYTENRIAYNKFLLTVKQINAIISKIPSIKVDKG